MPKRKLKKNGESKLEHKKQTKKKKVLKLSFKHTVHSNMRYTDVHSDTHLQLIFLRQIKSGFECWWLWVDSDLQVL